MDGRGRGHADTGNSGDFVDGGLLEASDRSEMGDQRFAAMLPNPGTESSAEAVIRVDRLLRW